jgi:hypothetical protein
MVHPQVVNGANGLQICRIAAHILNKQSWTDDKGWSSTLECGQGANNCSCEHDDESLGSIKGG